MKKGLFSDSDFNRRLVYIAGPVALQNLMLALVAAADAFMLGALDQNSMSAVSLATQIQFIQNMILSAFTSACVILGAQYWGKGDRGTIRRIFGMSLAACGVVSLIFFIGCVFFPRYLMILFTDEAELISIGASYLRIAGWSYLLTGISQCYLAAFKVIGHTDQSARISAFSVIFNIVMNAMLIFGLFGVPSLGVRGAAFATLSARIIELLWCLILSFGRGYLRPEIFGLFRCCGMLAADFFRCSMPLLGSGLLWGVGFTSYTAFVGHMGADAAGANSVASVVRDLVCCLCNGLGYGGGIIVGNELGAGHLDTGKEYGEKLMRMSFILGLISTGIMLALTPLLMLFVKLSDQAREYLVWMMVIMAVYMIGRTVNTVIINGVFASGGDTVFDLYSLVVSMWLIAVPLAAAGTFIFHWPVAAVYACTCLDEVGKIPWVILHYKKYKWVKDLTRDQNTD